MTVKYSQEALASFALPDIGGTPKEEKENVEQEIELIRK